ncbi:cellulose-binding protein [Saccharothrix sp. ALI-22-I]|uniref:lytic polysaccharide monooxygenase auxiliary activity family 9 protein n=1 Tax=Saccharothrix sp. ALI-22-I TaxID=1933778 RepID=UPI00097C6C24|nr:lytic polysaccharide monooxygenase auxiliary activity family 9 protein [Saccharothrix sp. ALI-22-I]ONI83555.1 cellulose-binding protein [Saccharothrix sp. ALI-22-I]
MTFSRGLRTVFGVFSSVLAVLAASVVVLVSATGTASAHGSVTDPPSRNYGCHQRWGSDHLNPNMHLTDPMCAQAWKADPNAMWNWNGLYRNGVGGNHQGALPNGQLCSGGLAEGGRYRALDAVGAWNTATKPRQFTLTITDQARHGADYLRIYITRQGVNTATSPLNWSDLELVTTTGRYPTTGLYQAQVNAGSRTGRHVVFTIWQASHMDQAYYLCSDVNFQ